MLEFLGVVPQYFSVLIPLDMDWMCLSLVWTFVSYSYSVLFISVILKAQDRYPLMLLSILHEVLPGVTILNSSPQSQQRPVFFVCFRLGVCR